MRQLFVINALQSNICEHKTNFGAAQDACALESVIPSSAIHTSCCYCIHYYTKQDCAKLEYHDITQGKATISIIVVNPGK